MAPACEGQVGGSEAVAAAGATLAVAVESGSSSEPGSAHSVKVTHKILSMPPMMERWVREQELEAVAVAQQQHQEQLLSGEDGGGGHQPAGGDEAVFLV